MNLKWYWNFFEGHPDLSLNGNPPSGVSCLMNEYRQTLYTYIRFGNETSIRVRCEAIDLGKVDVFVATDSGPFVPVAGVRGLRQWLQGFPATSGPGGDGRSNRRLRKDGAQTSVARPARLTSGKKRSMKSN